METGTAAGRRRGPRSPLLPSATRWPSWDDDQTHPPEASHGAADRPPCVPSGEVTGTREGSSHGKQDGQLPLFASLRTQPGRQRLGDVSVRAGDDHQLDLDTKCEDPRRTLAARREQRDSNAVAAPG